jgi:hypothetical protein
VKGENHERIEILRNEVPEMTILLIIAIVLFILWLLGFSTRFIASGAIHVVLVIAVILFAFWLLRVAFRAF